jgi:hypothetical protein
VLGRSHNGKNWLAYRSCAMRRDDQRLWWQQSSSRSIAGTASLSLGTDSRPPWRRTMPARASGGDARQGGEPEGRETERRRSRTDPAVGCTALLVLKTGESRPMRSDSAQLSAVRSRSLQLATGRCVKSESKVCRRSDNPQSPALLTTTHQTPGSRVPRRKRHGRHDGLPPESRSGMSRSADLRGEFPTPRGATRGHG